MTTLLFKREKTNRNRVRIEGAEHLTKPLLDHNDVTLQEPSPTHQKTFAESQSSALADIKAPVSAVAADAAPATTSASALSASIIAVGIKNPNASASMTSIAPSSTSAALASLMYSPQPITPLYPKVLVPSAPDYVCLDSVSFLQQHQASMAAVQAATAAATATATYTQHQPMFYEHTVTQTELQDFTVERISDVLTEAYKTSHQLATHHGMLEQKGGEESVRIAFLERSTPIPPPKEVKSFHWADLSSFHSYALNIFSKHYTRQCEALQRTVPSLASSDRVSLFFSDYGKSIRDQVSKSLLTRGLHVDWGCYYQVPGNHPWIEGNVPLYKNGTHVIYFATVKYQGVTFDLSVAEDEAEYDEVDACLLS